MLTELRVENLGIIAEITVPFGAGMTAITGETGAGKTLLVEALALLLGGRADPALVRDGSIEARVDGRFVHESGEIVLSRVVPGEGRSRAYIDGRPVTAGELAAVGATLVDLHGQHDQQSLLVPAAQRELLDAWIGPPAASCRERLRSETTRLGEVELALADLGGDERSRAREIDLLRYQITEIDSLTIVDADEETRLRSEAAFLGDTEAHRASLSSAYTSLSDAAGEAVGRALGELIGREPFAELESRLRDIQESMAEVARDLRVTADSIVSDPERLAEVAERLAAFRELRRKYGDSLAEVLDHCAESRARLAELESHDERAAALERQRVEIGAARLAIAAELTALRREHAPKLSARVTAVLRTLALPSATFSIAIESTELHDDGADRVTYELAPNPGETARPLAKAASGGELSRTMLAVRAVLSAAPPSLVFDEVDAGIGGEAGHAVGGALAGLGANHQVLCVTHLAQVAAHADAQVHVTKIVDGDRTVATASLLLDDARISELSRMLGGVGDSEHARRHAEELLAASRAARGASGGRGRGSRRASTWGAAR